MGRGGGRGARRAAVAGVMLAGLSAGCASSGAPARATVVALPARAEAGIGLDEAERGAFERIAAADPRFAKRLPAPPADELLRAAAVRALAEGDPDVSVRDGVLDFFSFTARGRALDDAAKLLAHVVTDAHAAPSGPVPRAQLERELAGRLVAEERARLEEERALPAGASALVRGIVDTWTPPASPEGASERDAWLTARLEQIRGSLAGSSLPRGPLVELDDALDPLERLAPPDALPSAAKAIAHLRVTLDATPSGAAGGDDVRRARLEAAVRAHLGLPLDARQLRARLERGERASRALAKTGVTEPDERAIARRAEEMTLARASCEASPSESRARSMAPPSERAAICGSLRSLSGAGADDVVAKGAALVALHDATVVALWALSIHADGMSPERATALAHPFFGAQPDREARLVRFAEASPVAAIGAGLAVELLLRAPATAVDGAAHAAEASAAGALAASKRWLAFGDAPLDVVEREVFPGAGGA